MIFKNFIMESLLTKSKMKIIEENKIGSVYYIIYSQFNNVYLLLNISENIYAKYLWDNFDINSKDKTNTIVSTALEVRNMWHSILDVIYFNFNKHSIEKVRCFLENDHLSNEIDSDYTYQMADYSMMKIMKPTEECDNRYMVSLFGRPYCYVEHNNTAVRICKVIMNDIRQIIEMRWGIYRDEFSDK